MIPRSIKPFVVAIPKKSYNASYKGIKYGSTFSFKSPGKNPKDSPASTAGLVKTSFLTNPFFSAATACATAKYVLPVPAGPTPNTSGYFIKASLYVRWLNVLGTTAFPVSDINIFFCDLYNSKMLSRRSEEHTSELQSRPHLVCRLL